MKIAILHEMLIKFGGAEKVIEDFLKIYPEADLFTLIYDEKKMGKFFPKQKIHPQVFTLFTQKIYNLFKKQRLCLTHMSKAVESLDFSGYDVVLCSSSGFAHGAITKPSTKFIVYYHSPARYLWDWTNEYKKDIGFNSGIKGYFLNSLFLKLRIWDFIASNRNDIIIANSKNTQKRIKKYYKLDSILLYPGIDTTRFGKKVNISGENIFASYYIIISALTEFKKIDIAIKGFNNIVNSNLIIIGGGDYKKELIKLVTGKNIKFVGTKYGDDLVSLVQNSNGLIFPGEEDFGIVPIEVMAAGKPVFAYFGGGLKETVIEGITGEFFYDKLGFDFIKHFEKFNQNNLSGKYKISECKKQAELFSQKVFEEKIRKIVL